MKNEKMIDIPASEVQAAVDDYLSQNWTIVRKFQQPNGLWTIEASPPADKVAAKKPASVALGGSLAGFSEPSVAMASVSGNSDDVLTLARTIYGEARGQSREGMEAIANVVVNRVKSGRYPNSISQVCLQPFQFSCWNKNDPNRDKIKDLVQGANNVFDECLEIAQDAASGTLPDHTAGATHYYATYIATPSWVTKSPNAKLTAEIGVHRFYSGIA